MGDKVKKSAKNDQPAAVPQGVMQQMQPMLNQSFGQHGGKSTRLNMDGTIKDMNAPSGLDWLEAHGPDRANVQARYERLGRELRPAGGLPWMAQQGAQAVEAQKQLQQMLPQDSHSVTQQWGGDDVGAVSTAMKNGVPVGFSTNTPQAKNLHQFSPHDFVAMLGQLPQGAPTQQGSASSPGDERIPVNAFTPHFNPDNPDNMYVRERQRHNPYTEQIKPQLKDYGSALGELLDKVGQQPGNLLADFLGYSDKLPPVQPHELPRAQVGPPSTTIVVSPYGIGRAQSVATPQQQQMHQAPGLLDQALSWLFPKSKNTAK